MARRSNKNVLGHHMAYNTRWRLENKWADLWIGVFWRAEGNRNHAWLTVGPVAWVLALWIMGPGVSAGGNLWWVWWSSFLLSILAGWPCAPLHVSWDAIAVPPVFRVAVFNQSYERVTEFKALPTDQVVRDIRAGTWRDADGRTLTVLGLAAYGPTGTDMYVTVDQPEVDSQAITDAPPPAADQWVSWDDFYSDIEDDMKAREQRTRPHIGRRV